MFTTLSTLLSCALLLAAVTPSMASSSHSRPRAVHNALAKRAVADMQVYKRFSNTRWTFYDVGLGACGITNAPSDWIVALNSIQFGPGYPGQHCFKNIVMSYNGKTATATIVDSCPGCPYGGLDLSRGLFSYFADQDIGVISGEWFFADVPTRTAAPLPPTPPNVPATMHPMIVTSAVHAADAIITKATKAKKKKTKARTRTGTGTHIHTNSYTITTPWQIAAATDASTPKKKHAFHTAATLTPRPTAATPSVTITPPMTTDEGILASSSPHYESIHSSMLATFTTSPASNSSAASHKPSAISSTKSTGNTTAAFENTDAVAEIQSNIQALSALLLRFGELLVAGSFLGRQDN